MANPHAFGFKDLADLPMPDTADEVDVFEALKTRTCADGNNRKRKQIVAFFSVRSPSECEGVCAWSLCV